ncbi:MAG: hypothetical protein ACQEXJ_00015 [Myxococcota bacterium]
MSKKSLAERLSDLARETYPDARTRLHEDPQGRIYGTIVSGSFAGVDEAERQRDFYTLVESKLGADTRRKLLVVFTNTPDEDVVFERDREHHVG